MKVKPLHAKVKGNIGHFSVAVALMRLGYPVFSELGDNSKVDLICLVGSKAVRIQVKSATLVAGAVVLYAEKAGPNYRFRYSADDVDVFAVYCMDTGGIAFVQAAELLAQRRRSLALRVAAPKNGQRQAIRMFSDYSSFDRAVTAH